MSGSGKYRQIVDEKDEVIGHKLKDEFEPENDIYRVSALWLRNSQGQVLMAQRDKHKKNGGELWGPAVAGTLEYDETYEQNIVKEMREEIGLSELSVKEGRKRLFHDNGRRYFCTYFYGVCDWPEEKFVLERHAVAAVKWVDESWLLNDTRNNPQNYVQGMVGHLEEIMNDCRN